MSDKNSSVVDTFLSFVAGAATGFVLGILFAPESGRETRRKLREKVIETGDAARENYEKLAREAERGLRVVREKTTEGIDAIKEFIEKKREEFQKSAAECEPGSEPEA